MCASDGKAKQRKDDDNRMIPETGKAAGLAFVKLGNVQSGQ